LALPLLLPLPLLVLLSSRSEAEGSAVAVASFVVIPEGDLRLSFVFVLAFASEIGPG
jgi:hypothetical protein